MSIPDHHKAIAKNLRDRLGDPATVTNYRDNQGQRPIPVGAFGASAVRFYSTIGICDSSLSVPASRFELAAIGNLEWLPNALVSSVYWLQERTAEAWPVICEDVVRQNVKSSYRHMGFVLSEFELGVTDGDPIRWLLGTPLKDSEISISLDDLWAKTRKAYPTWLGGVA